MPGALATGLSDRVRMQAGAVTGHSGAAAAALTCLLRESGQGINALMVPLALTQSATVRLADRLAADGFAERRPGGDGRSTAVCLTAQGEKAACGILAERRRVIAGSLAGLTAGERIEARRALARTAKPDAGTAP